MLSKKGKFVVIDGPDATGKKTQTALLVERLQKHGQAAIRLPFPRYDNDSSYLVRLYLGREGTTPIANPAYVGPYFASTFYAFDRWKAADGIRKALLEGSHVVCDRYVTSNLGHQGGQIEDAAERKKYYEWNLGFEYGVLGLPKPDCTIFLHLPFAIASDLLAERFRQAALLDRKAKHDSLDVEALQRRAHKVYEELARIYGDDYSVVECVENGDEMLDAEAIHGRIWQLVSLVIS